MRTAHKNKIAEYLLQATYGADAFELYDGPHIDEIHITTIEFKNSPFVFKIQPFPNDYNAYSVNYTQYSPRLGKVNPSPQQVLTIEEVIGLIERWLNREVKPFLEDQNTIDIWAEYKNGIRYLKVEVLDTKDIGYFSTDDIVRIKFAIRDLKLLINRRFDFTSEQMMIVNEKLDYLVEVANRAPVTDWKGVAVSVIASIIIALSLDTARGGQLWELFLQVFRNIALLTSIAG